MTWLWILLAFVVLVAVYDLVQKRHAILRNFPLIGHFRYWLEAVGPELRQYIVTSNNEERPFSRDDRRWVYASSKNANNYFGFGTDQDLEMRPNHLIIKHSTMPRVLPDRHDPLYSLPFAKVIGAHRKRAKAFRPSSIVNINAMSYGSLSGPAVEAMNRGCATARCLQWTGEGGVSQYHQKGGELVWQIGTGYFGCRDARGRFDLARFKDVVASNPIRMVEIKLGQGAKPGLGGVLPAAKITPEVSRIRGVPMGADCVSPPGHTAFAGIDGLLDFVEELAAETGLPIGIKSPVGLLDFWTELAQRMAREDRGVDFINIDGGEGGTGAAPLVFSDHVALPFKIAFTRVYRVFAERELHEQVVFLGAGKLGFPQTGLFAMAMGCDGINVAREAMLAVGCIQAQRCHTGHCPTGVATQNKWLMRGLDPMSKADRLANYLVSFRKELTQLSRACGVLHPALVGAKHFEILDERFGAITPQELFHYERSWGLPSYEDREEITRIMTDGAPVPDQLPITV